MGSKGGVLGGMTQKLFGDGGAGAAQNAAMAQQGAAGQNYNYIKGIVDKSTTQGMMDLDRDIKNQERNLSRQEQMVSQIDPTIIEASQQALRLLRGEQSSTLDPLKNQRDQQRQKLVNSLREQLGPGAETSTAGIQALTRFDSESGNLFAGAQQQALQNLGNTAGQFNQVRPDMFREIMGLSTFGQAKSNLGFKQADIMNQAFQPVIGSAGAQYTADVMKGQQNAAFGQQLFNGMMSNAQAGLTAGMGGAPKK